MNFGAARTRDAADGRQVQTIYYFVIRLTTCNYCPSDAELRRECFATWPSLAMNITQTARRYRETVGKLSHNQPCSAAAAFAVLLIPTRENDRRLNVSSRTEPPKRTDSSTASEYRRVNLLFHFMETRKLDDWRDYIAIKYVRNDVVFKTAMYLLIFPLSNEFLKFRQTCPSVLTH